ncbi:ABC transporter permease [Orenia marismortui]|uniref:ABC-2 type transport system permease protein n=1 Tax=Orenia marismortui TaxID=46469 RepID=A0A4V3GXK6_9FIRM|nr:ABC-2 family transporter protein [Orenia marismortui]TDX48369.1 ABC-2 type transport system permease protein [Orenia marismortui]
MKRYLKVYLKMLAAHIKSLMQYKFDFLIGVISTVSLQAANLAMIWVIFQNVTQIKGYSYEHILLIYGTALLAKSINHIFFDNLWLLPQRYVQHGEMDRLLTKPLNPLFYLIAERWQEDGIGNLLVGLFIVKDAVAKLNFEFTAFTLVIYTIFILMGGLLYASINLITSSFSFRFVKVFPLIELVHDLNEFTRYPIYIFDKFFRILLTWIIPFAFASFYPVEALLDGFKSGYSFIIIPFALLFSLLAYRIWLWNLGAYSSTGS